VPLGNPRDVQQDRVGADGRGPAHRFVAAGCLLGQAGAEQASGVGVGVHDQDADDGRAGPARRCAQRRQGVFFQDDVRGRYPCPKGGTGAEPEDRHCCIAEVGDCLVVRDFGSTNGTRINGRRLREGRLRVGDELMIGDRRFRVGADVGGARAEPALSPGCDRKKTVLADEALEACDGPVPLDEAAALPDSSRLGR